MSRYPLLWTPTPVQLMLPFKMELISLKTHLMYIEFPKLRLMALGDVR